MENLLFTLNTQESIAPFLVGAGPTIASTEDIKYGRPGLVYYPFFIDEAGVVRENTKNRGVPEAVKTRLLHDARNKPVMFVLRSDTSTAAINFLKQHGFTELMRAKGNYGEYRLVFLLRDTPKGKVVSAKDLPAASKKGELLAPPEKSTVGLYYCCAGKVLTELRLSAYTKEEEMRNYIKLVAIPRKDLTTRNTLCKAGFELIGATTRSRTVFLVQAGEARQVQVA